MPDGDRLGDHPTERRPHHMGSRHVEVVEQRCCIVGHVVEQVRHRRHGALPGPSGHDRRQIDHFSVELGRQSSIAVVEPDDVEPGVGEPATPFVRPRDELRTEPHHEQDGGIAAPPGRLVAELDPVTGGEWHPAVYQPTSASTSPHIAFSL